MVSEGVPELAEHALLGVVFVAFFHSFSNSLILFCQEAD
jgi:hypothetical protein